MDKWLELRRTPAGRAGTLTADRSRRRPQTGRLGGTPGASIFRPEFREALGGLREGDEILVLTWLHQGRRDVLSVHPRGDANRSRTRVFVTRSPDRPNPIGLHAVVIETVEEDAITVRDLEAIDGTPVVDVKPVLGRPDQR